MVIPKTTGIAILFASPLNSHRLLHIKPILSQPNKITTRREAHHA